LYFIQYLCHSLIVIYFIIRKVSVPQLYIRYIALCQAQFNEHEHSLWSFPLSNSSGMTGRRLFLLLLLLLWLTHLWLLPLPIFKPLRSLSLFDVVLKLFIFLSPHLVNLFLGVFRQVSKKLGGLSGLLRYLLEISFTSFLPELV